MMALMTMRLFDVTWDIGSGLAGQLTYEGHLVVDGVTHTSGICASRHDALQKLKRLFK